MSWIAGLRARFAQAANRSSSESRMDEEFQFHLEMETELLESTGLSPAEARRRALLSFGGREGHRETIREQRKIPFFDDFVRDLGYGLRTLRRSPAYATAAVLTLALGIAGTTITFGVIDALFLRDPVGVVDADRLVRVLIGRDEGMITAPAGMVVSYPDLEGVRNATISFHGVAGFTWPTRIDFGRGAAVTQVEASAVTGDFFHLLGVTPAVGRLFSVEDDRAGNVPVAVLSHAFWMQQFSGDRSIVGSQIRLKGTDVTVVGVARKGFVGSGMERSDLWVTSAMASDMGMTLGSRDDGTAPAFNLIGRLRPEVTPESAAAEAQSYVPRGWQRTELDPNPEVLVIPLEMANFPGTSAYGRTTLWLGGAAAFLLLIACSSVGNMLLARGASRGRELAVRGALGAGGGRLLRQLLTESLLLALLGGGVAVLLAYAAGGLVRQFDAPPGADVVNHRVLLFALAACVVTTFVAGLMPAMKVLPARLSSRLGTRVETGSIGRTRLRKALTGLQVGIACVLLVASGLSVRSFLRILAVETGVDTDQVLMVSVDVSRFAAGPADIDAFYRDAHDRLEALPGIESSAVAQFPPFSGNSIRMHWSDLDGEPIPTETGPGQNWVSRDYFATVGTAFRSAEVDPSGLTAGDDGTVIVSATTAELLRPGGDVIGECLRRYRIGGCLRIVGVVEDVRQRILDPAVSPMVYIPYESAEELAGSGAWGSATLLVRTERSAPASPEQVRMALQTLRPDLPFVRVEPLEARIRPELTTYRMGTMVLSAFGALALLLAVIGSYGVLSYFITARSPEIGIRRSLGAPSSAIVRVTLREGLGPVVPGLAAGLLVAALGSKYLEPLLFQTASRDPIVFVAVAALLITGAFAAVLLPTVRALSVAPARLVRAE